MDVISYALSRKYTQDSLAGVGALKGAPCRISQITDNPDGTHTITFLWVDDNGVSHTSVLTVKDGATPVVNITPITGGHRVTFTTDGVVETVDIMDGVSITNVEINSNDHLIVTLSDGNTIDCGEIATKMSKLEDVTINNPQDGEILIYDSSINKWVNKELDVAVNIEDLENVDINPATLTNGAIIKYDSSSQKWINSSEALNDISDVTVTTPQNKQVLKYNGSRWVNSDNKVVDLADVQVINPVAGQILVYDPVAKKWVNDSPSSTTTKLDDLADVDITQLTLEDKQILAYDATNQMWVNADNTMTVESLDAIQDVDIQNIQDGQIIVWDNNLQKWVNANVATKLRDLTDVSLGTLADLDLIRYSLTRQRWENYSADNVVTENSVNVVTSGAVFTAIKNTVDKIGDLTTLKTTDKTTIVNALNEVYDALVDLTDKVGDITTLTTTDKTSVVNAINELVTKVNAMKYLEQVTTMGDPKDFPNRVLQYIGSDTADYKRGYIYRSTPSIVEGEIVYSWERIDVQPTNNNYNDLINKPQINSVELVGDKSLDDLGIQKIFQYSTLPTPSATLVGTTVMYTGATTADYKTNYFYTCQYVTADAQYEWVQVDVSSNAELVQRITDVENDIGDMSTLTIAGVSDIVSALNVLAIRGIKSITYSKPYLTITLQDNTTYNFDVSSIISTTDIGEFANVLDATIQNTNTLAYDSSILKYKPYDIVGALSDTLQASKNYTDQEIGKINLDDAFYCDAKPTISYDSAQDKYIIVYYQATQVHTTTDISARFYYKDSNQDPYCTSWFLVESGGVTTPVELSYLLSSVNLDDYVSKTNDVVSTYTTTMVDKSKIPDIGAMDALYTIVATALGLKVNISDINNTLTSDATDAPLSAKQGKVLKGYIDEKQNIIQLDTMPVCDNTYVGKIYQYVGTTSSAYTQGRFYIGTYDALSDVYSWQEVKFSADYDTTIIQNSTNAPQGGAVYDALELKQPKTLDTPLTIGGATKTTVETALGGLNTAKADVFQVTTMASPSASLENIVVQYIGATTSSYTEGYFYKCKEILPSTTPATYEWVALTSKIDVDNALSATSENPVQNKIITNTVQALQGGVTVTYASESVRPTELDMANGIILTVGSIAYCLAEKTYYKVTAINPVSQAITWTAYDPHIASDDDVETRLEKVTALPTATIDTVGKVLLLTANQTGYQRGGIYKGVSDGSDPAVYSWELISISPLTFDADDFSVANDNVALNPKQRVFKGTQATWNTLSTADKAKYEIVILTDDTTAGTGDDRKQPKLLQTPIVIDGVTYTSVEDALQYMAYTINNLLIWNSGI